MSALVKIHEPVAYCVTLAEAKAHLRVDHPDEDAIIENLIIAASDYVERYTRITLTWTRYRYTLDGFPSHGWEIELPRRPLVLNSDDNAPPIDFKNETPLLWRQDASATSAVLVSRAPQQQGFASPVVKFITGIDVEHETTWMPDDEQFLARDGNPPLVALWGAMHWPILNTWNPFPVSVEFTAGFSSSGTKVPKQLKQAVLLLVGHWYNTREAASNEAGVPAPYAVEAILSLYDSGEYV